ncbi:MAG: hypothetical protein MI673_00760, partial [Thiotrichales bacterium]|nr:hypothetical protein [Thiotrichales bacterium]
MPSTPVAAAASRRLRILTAVAALPGALGLLGSFANAATLPGIPPGEAGVDPSGAATYRIPIEIPPGTGGLGPELALVYSSRGGEGLLGRGWSLAGLSSITRCGQIIASDGMRMGVKFTSGDRFCAGARRLKSTDGSYGADGTRYRHEIDDLTRYTSNGTQGSGPRSFTARTKSGLTLSYGSTASGRFERTGASDVATWALDRMEDSAGNHLSVRYVEDSGSGAHRPIRIDYAGNEAMGISPNASVRFVYEARPITTRYFLGGSVFSQMKRLAAVETWLGATRVRSYRLTYSTDPKTAESRLEQVKICDAAGECLPPIDVRWEARGIGHVESATFARTWTTGYFNNRTPHVGDVNGDGHTDMVWTAQYRNGFGIHTALAKKTGGLGSRYYDRPSASGDRSDYRSHIGDFNGDGILDVAWTGSTNGYGPRAYVARGIGN